MKMESKECYCANSPCSGELLKKEYLTCSTPSTCVNIQGQNVYQKPRLELRHDKTKCNQCRKTIERIRNLLDEIINTKEISATVPICKSCKKLITFKYCPRCEAMAHKCLTCQDKRNKMKAFTESLLKLKYLLTTLLHSHNICQHTTSKDTDLERIFNEIRSPIYARRPVIEYFPDIGERQLFAQSISESRELLDMLLSRIEAESEDMTLLLKDSESTSSCIESCICKVLKNEMQKKTLLEPSTELSYDMNAQKPAESYKSIEVESHPPSKEHKVKKGFLKSVKPKNKFTKSPKRELRESSYTLMQKIFGSEESEEKLKENMESNATSAAKTYDVDKSSEQKQMKVDDLLDVWVSPLDMQDSKSSSLAECEQSGSRKYIIQSTCLLPYDSEYESSKHAELFTKREFFFESLVDFSATLESTAIKKQISHKKRSGIIRYRLSNKAFIHNGWTELPKETVVRRLNLYEMKTVDLENNWFERYKTATTINYDSGEKFADINNECGVWFYRNGSKALEYYYSSETKAGCRCIIYDCEETDNTKRSSKTLAMFDFYGNGVIYDTHGNIRLKYNQSEGVIVDPKIGFPSRWKWHTLNDPPVLRMFRINTRLEPIDNHIKRLHPGPHSNVKVTPVNAAAELIMQKIESEMLIKDKIKPSFQPCLITMKIAKINKFFSVRVNTQKKILLTYRNRSTVLKLNLGMALDSNRIIGFDFSDASEVEILNPFKYRSEF